MLNFGAIQIHVQTHAADPLPTLSKGTADWKRQKGHIRAQSPNKNRRRSQIESGGDNGESENLNPRI